MFERFSGFTRFTGFMRFSAFVADEAGEFLRSRLSPHWRQRLALDEIAHAHLPERSLILSKHSHELRAPARRRFQRLVEFPRDLRMHFRTDSVASQVRRESNRFRQRFVI